MSAPTIRACKDIRELEACVMLQKEVWNFDDVDLIPLRLFVVATKIGGQVIGAFDADELIGFAMSIPGTRNRNAYLHSHMLAVRETFRNTGLGRKLKLAQRDDALGRGIRLIEWTFDPLEIKNAWLNIERLGAIARRYNPNQYGMSSSPLQGGLPTDRLVAEWWLDSDRVKKVLSGSEPTAESQTKISVPGEIYDWKRAADPRARDLQSRNREAFQKNFSAGLAVLRFERDCAKNGTYLLGKWNEDLNFGSTANG
ncbi:MAG: GNAT family N-acetyltransferase [Terriglobales bacterium]|jgi:predicted GNAT superfamily acetyltransferase